MRLPWEVVGGGYGKLDGSCSPRCGCAHCLERCVLSLSSYPVQFSRAGHSAYLVFLVDELFSKANVKPAWCSDCPLIQGLCWNRFAFSEHVL